MPTDEENVQYLYLILTSTGPPNIDWKAVGEALDLKPGAVSKRWSRLKKAIADGKNPGHAAYELLWLCVKHSTRNKAPDWNDIATKCNTTAGAASKRYSRMKQAFENGAIAPTSAATKGADDEAPAPKTSPVKRKRAPPKKKAIDESVEDVEDDEEMVKEEPKPKRARAPAKPRVKATTKKVKEEVDEEKVTISVPPTEATTLIKHEQDADEDKGHEQSDSGEASDGEEEIAQERVNEWLQEVDA